MLSGIDSLNNLTSDNEYEIEEKIRKYFEETDLPTDEIEKRIGFALDIERVFRDVFILMIASEMMKELESKADYYSNMAYEGYIGAMEDNGYSVDPTGMGYVEQYARSRCKEIVDTAILHKADAFYGTLEHTIAIGEDESMAVGNYQREQLAIAQGYTQKTWVTCSDDRVRESHRLVDGQTIGIFQPFHLRGGQMMFPLDSSLGVNKREIYGCRCICEYSGREESFETYRRNENLGVFSVLEEEMSLKHVRSVVKDMNVAKDVKYKIDRSEEMLNVDITGHTSNDGKVITLFPNAFKNREQLVKTLGHEDVHLKQVRKNGKVKTTDELYLREEEARASEDRVWKEYVERTNYRR